MSRKLADFIALLHEDKDKRDEADMGAYVTWLRRRNPILRNLETKHVIQVIRNSTHQSLQRDDVIFHQGKPRDSDSPLHVYIILRGSASLFNNPFMTQGKSSRRSSYSLERILLTSALENARILHPKSAASKSTGTRLSPIVTSVVDEDLDEVEDDVIEDEIVNETEGEAEPDVEEAVGQDKDSTDGTSGIENACKMDGDRTRASGTPVSRVSKKSKQSARTKLGNFVVKYEKGKYVSEEAVLDDDDMYTGSVIIDESTDLIVMDEHTFDKYIKEHHEKDAIDLTDFVDYHPLFRDLPLQSKGIIQISLKKHHHEAGTFIVKQGEPVKNLKFIISGSAEEMIEPGKHRYQFPEFWPFETSTDVYYNECEWLRDSRRRIYKQRYEYQGEVSRRQARGSGARKEVSVCAVLDREVLGITEVMLNLGTYVQGYRCLHNCDVYSLSLKPFRRISRRNGELKALAMAYVKMKLDFRMKNSMGDKVPFLNCLYTKVEAESPGKSHNDIATKNIEKIRDREAELVKVLEWFKQDKAPLINNKDPGIVQLKETMKEKARIRQSVQEHSKVKPFFRRGCLRAVKPSREPLSLHRLRDPVSEVLLRLRMEGTFIQTEEELDEILQRFSETPIEREEDISRQRHRVMDEEYNLFRYRRHGNQLIRKFSSMLDHKNMTREQTIVATALLHDNDSDVDVNLRRIEEEGSDEFESRAISRFTKRTAKSYASTYRPLQFDRRSVTPGTIEMRVKDFHASFDTNSPHFYSAPSLARYDTDNVGREIAPLPGGKVFVTKAPCVSCSRNILLKDHSHRRCHMLHSLPMNKVKGYRATDL